MGRIYGYPPTPPREEIGWKQGKRKPTYKKCPSPFFRFSYSRAKQSPRFHLAWHLSLPVPCLPRSQHTPTEPRLLVVGSSRAGRRWTHATLALLSAKVQRGRRQLNVLTWAWGKRCAKINARRTGKTPKTGNGEKNAELCRMSCCAVAWRAGRERQTDSWRHRGGHSSRSDNAMRRMILGSGSRDSRWYQCAPPAPGAPGVSWPQAGPGLVTSSNRTDSAAVHRSTPACHESMAASIPPNLHGKLSSFWTGNLEGNWRGAASFVVYFLAFFQRPGLLFQHCVSMHVIFCGGTSSTPRSPPELYSAAGLAIVSLEMCWPASAEVWINSHHANQRTAVVAGGSGSGGNRL